MDPEKQSIVKARKRHFDSRWRASIANCFETLLHVVPMSKRAIKKQSKANILEATAQHLDFLEKTIVSLLQARAYRLGIEDVNQWCENEIGSLKTSFISEEMRRPRGTPKARQRNRFPRVLMKATKPNVSTKPVSLIGKILQPIQNIQNNAENIPIYVDLEDITVQEEVLTETETVVSFSPSESTNLLNFETAIRHNEEREKAQDFISKFLCCNEDINASDDEGISSPGSFGLTPESSFNPTDLKVVRKRKANQVLHRVPRKCWRSLSSEFKAASVSTEEKNSTSTMESIKLQKQAVPNKDLVFINESSDPWLLSDFFFRKNSENSTSCAHPIVQEDDQFKNVEFFGKDSPLFGQSFDQLLNI